MSEPPETVFADVAERVAPRLFRVALRMCGSPDDAEDLVQDTLLQGFRKWPQFEGRSEPTTWLYTIAARLCQRRRRRRAGEPRRMESLSELLPSADDPTPVLGVSPGESPLQEHARREAEQTVAEALTRIPSHYRLPLVLADIAELSTPEVARILGLKEATVKTRIHRARLALRRALLERLPSRPAPPADHDRQVCLDLLHAKQEALDRGVPFPVSPDELCVRCRATFATLDLGRELCGLLGHGDLPSGLRELIRSEGGLGGSREPAPGRRDAAAGTNARPPRNIQRRSARHAS